MVAKLPSILWGGGYSGEGILKPIFSTHLYPGSYRLAALWVDSYGVYTNRVSGGALRGYGCAESAWAVETQMDIIARKCDIDAVELRINNLLNEGERTAITMPAHAFSAHECLTKCADAIEWGNPHLNRWRIRGIVVRASLWVTSIPSHQPLPVRS